jgi:6-phosphogluconolactonase (cycloisomerase 2 family)
MAVLCSRPSPLLVTHLCAVLFTRTLAALVVIILARALVAQPISRTLVFVGTYTGGVPAAGIHVFHLDEEQQRLVPVCQAEGLVNPSYLSLSPDGSTLLACTESKMANNGNVRAFAVDSARGTLRALNAMPSAGENPVYVAVDASGRWVVNANYTEASIALHALHPDGSLGNLVQHFRFSGEGSKGVPERQDLPHVHAAVFAPDNAFLYVPDLGCDRIRVFRFDAEAEQPLTMVDSSDVQTTAGSGPRHLVFHPSGRFAYCVEELGGSVVAYRMDRGQLTALQRSDTYAIKPAIGNSADIHCSPDGRHVYVSNRGPEENSVACFAVHADTGLLTLVGHSPCGDGPRGFELSTDGKYVVVASVGTNEVQLYSRDAITGQLTAVGTPVHVPHPASVRIRRYSVAR